MSFYEDDVRTERVIRELRETLGIVDDLKLDPDDLLRRLKIAGFIDAFGSGGAETIRPEDAKWSPERRAIILGEEVAAKATAQSDEARFTVAHEVAHMLSGDPARYRRSSGARLQFGRHIEADEERADRLARALLVPAYLAQVTLSTTVEELMTRFGLPAEQSKRRLDELKRMYRRERGIKRELPATNAPRPIDTSSYDDVFPEMLRNAARYNQH